ncbi:hypothetical protein M378DRAFT_179974 [Amanita muscaria Koide BX008]|uniref:FAD-binding domain-containing protein n=1 Tax=Amanita muscaria (strain Koide BX008) TaxID=946122 RepID=A0A0C2WY60_AMAMK|nr:hypothetical protein M378DRAFT_179974 [Amanita muscaria Koide BX008]
MSQLSVKIAIIGSGPGGLTLARLLQKEDVPFTLYERDSSPDERNQGGSLDIHSGQVALRAAGLIEEFTKLARFEADCTKLVAPDGTVLLNEAEGSKGGGGNEGGPPERSRPEIDRVVLRDMLLSSLDPGTVQYGYKLRGVEPCTDSSGKETYTLDFGRDVKEGPFDVVIGADGASSRVRPILTDAKPFYSGITAVELWALEVEKRHPWLASYVGAGNCWMFDQDRAVFAQRNGNESIRVYACVKRADEDWSEACGIDWLGSSTRQQLVDKEFADCGEDVKKMIMDADDRLVLRRLEMLPVGMTWPRHGGVTLLGDAAHVMTPFAGEGVNAAMQDAHELSEAIVSGVGKGVEGVVEELGVYERRMFERTRGLAQTTWDQMQGMCFSKDGADKFLELISSGGPPTRADE